MMAPVTLLALRGHPGLRGGSASWALVALAEQPVETVTMFGSTGFTEPGGATKPLARRGLVWAWLLAFAVRGGVRGRAQNPAA